MKQIFEVMQQSLNQYSQGYSSEISSNKEIRARFNQICNKMGIDPIVSKFSYKKAKDQFGEEYSEISTIKSQYKFFEFVKNKKSLMGGL